MGIERSRTGLSRSRWEYIKALRPSPGRLVFQSVVAVTSEPTHPKQGPPVTRIEKRTFFDFRNARKAAYREDARRSA